VAHSPILEPPDRREQQRNEVRASILAAAQALIADQGADALSMRRLAERCGYTVPTLYHHFGGKLGLVEAVLDEVFRELVSGLRAIAGGHDPVARLRAMLRCFVDFGLRVPVHYRLLMTPVSDAIPMPPSLEEARALLDRALEALAREGRLREPDPAKAAQVIYVATHGLISLPSQRTDIAWAEDLVEVALEAILSGLVAPAEGRA